MLLRRQSRLGTFADLGIALLAVVAFESLVSTAIVLKVGSSPEELDEALKPYLIPMMVGRTLWCALWIGLVIAARRQLPATVGLTARNLGINVGIGIAGGATMFGVAVIFGLITWFLFPEFRHRLDDNTDRLKDFIPNLSTGGFGLLALLIAINEELLFRGFLMPRLRRLFGSWTAAVLVSTTLFTVLHLADQEWFVLPMIYVLSLMMSVLTIWRRSLIPAVVVHAVFDFAQFVLLRHTTLNEVEGMIGR